MDIRVTGLIAIGELTCDGCGKPIRHPQRYGSVSEEGKPPLRLCEDCCRSRGYLKRRKDEKGREVETFL